MLNAAKRKAYRDDSPNMVNQVDKLEDYNSDDYDKHQSKVDVKEREREYLRQKRKIFATTQKMINQLFLSKVQFVNDNRQHKMA